MKNKKKKKKDGPECVEIFRMSEEDIIASGIWRILVPQNGEKS